MQGGSTGIVYGGLKYQARCIADVSADPYHTSFLAGTLSLKEENEVHLIRLSPSGTELVCEGLFYHSNEIWDLKSCPFNPRIFSTVFTSGETHGAAIWEIPELYGQTNALEQLVALNEHTFKIKCILWWPLGKHDKLVSIDEGNLFLWSIDSSTKAAKVISQESVGMLHTLSGGAWDPHDRNAVAAICDSSLQCWDLRSMKKSNSIEHAHVRDVDYNPKKQHILVPPELRRNLFGCLSIFYAPKFTLYSHSSYFDIYLAIFNCMLKIFYTSQATAEDESGLRLWDLRMPKLPVREFPGHAHWTWAVRHNPEYDQLILSAGTDSAVNLWLASSIGNSDSTPDSLVDSPTRQIDPLLNSYSDYEDSVYGLAWSSRDPTIFTSLSYDGRVVVESVKPYLQKK